MRRAKRITALAVAAAMVFSNVAYAAPGTDTTTTQAGAESAESLNSQSDASGGIEGQASDQTGNGTDSSAQAEQQTETKKTDTQNTTTDAGSQIEAQTTQEETAKEETTKDETSSQTPSTDTQTQETPSTEAEAQKAEEKQEASKTEEEKVLYDITFETPEKHGKVTDMDGNEVADGKTLKTDENGKVQFKVKADDGYQVSAVYQMPDEQTPLKLVKDSYYELQVDENTTVKVVYQKIPEANEDGEDAGEADSTADSQKETATSEKGTDGEKKAEAEKTPTIKAMLAADNGQTIKVEVVDEAGSLLGEYDLPMGEIKSHLPTEESMPAIEGKEFKRALVEGSNTEITYLAYYQEDYYYSTSGDNVAGIKLSGDTIQLVYGEITVTHNITYNVYVGNKLISEDQISEYLSLDGPRTIVDGNNLEFLMSAKKGYEINRVLNSSLPVNGDNGKYNITNVTDDLNISIYVNKIATYNISFRGSNTYFTYGRESFRSGAGENHGSVRKFDYSADLEELTFTLHGCNEYTSEDKELNKLTISIGDNENVAVLLPGEIAGGGNEATTNIDGVTITVERSNRKSESSGVSSYTYTVTISNPEKIRENISIVTNFKDAESQELFVKQTVGVGGIDGASGVYNSEKSTILDPTKGNDSFINISQGRNENYLNFHFNVLPGYIDDPEYISVTGTYDGIDASTYISEIKNSNISGYKYCVTVTIPAYYTTGGWPFEQEHGTKTTDWRLFFTATPNDNYKVNYD